MSASSRSQMQEPTELFARMRAGDQVAWTQLVDACSPKLMRVVRRRLDRPLRSLCDSMDVTNEVFASLAFKFADFDFESLEKLMTFLANAAEQKIVDEYRRRHAQKRDMDRERPINASATGEAAELRSPGPSPSQVAQATEEWERLHAFTSGVTRRVIELKREGDSNEEVARKTELPLRQVQRMLRKLREQI